MKIAGIGAGGHARVIIDILQCAGEHEIVGIIDRNPDLKGSKVEDVPVIGSDELLPELLGNGIRHMFIGVGGVGDNSIRARLYDQLKQLGFTIVRAIHPNAIVAKSAVIGEGSAVMAGAILNPGARIGDDTIINTGSVVDHDCYIGDHVHIAPGVTLSGNVVIGAYSHVGTGASVRQGVKIGTHTVVGAGAVVVKDLPNDATAVGVPAAIINRHLKR
jgi:sugar O-acyltransferase (sialic acid O-acetyltransferase NeuD family)